MTVLIFFKRHFYISIFKGNPYIQLIIPVFIHFHCASKCTNKNDVQ